MNKTAYIVPSSALLAAILAYQWKQDTPGSRLSGESTQANRPVRTLPSRNHDERSLAAKGLLWEPVSIGKRERVAKSIPVAAESFAESTTLEVGEAVTLRLSGKVPALPAAITSRKTENDGTVVTQLRIAGEPEGQLTIQENAGMDFFVAQLYYGNHPVAYEFTKSVEGMVATRHELSDLICSLIDHKEGEVEHMGLPPVDKIRGKKSDIENGASVEQARKGGILEAKSGGGTAAPLVLSVSDQSGAEGNGGISNITFTVQLSKADRKNSISVRYATADGTAMAGSDFTAVSGTLTIPAGRTSATFSVPVLGDIALEDDETFSVILSNPVNATLGRAEAIGTITNDDSPPSLVPVFNSLPGAVAVAYLDMDGQTVSGTQWASGATIIARGIVGTLSNAQMLDICRRTAEDFSLFQINVTTDESVFLAAPSNRRIRCIITPDNEWYGSAGGVAYLNSFTWTGDTPCWVFSDMLANSSRYIAEATTHEIGHTLTLRHDGRISPTEGYYEGHGTGETGWAPVMGVGYYKPLVQWSKGEYLSANNTEDDLARITTQNGFGYRADQVGDSISSASPLTGTSGARSAAGIIETGADVDVFSFATAGGACTFTALGDANSQNLDIQLEILSASGAVIASVNPDALTDATVSATLPAGIHFLRISGAGRGDVLTDGYSDYGSIGQYTISGNAP